jgi:hypothetical protein
LHPAAQDAIDRYSAIFDENDRLLNENKELRSENEMLRRVDAEKTALISDLRRATEESQGRTDLRIVKLEADYRQRIGESERAKERYLRYAVSISERLKACGEQITAAHEAAMDMAKTGGIELENEIAKILEESKNAAIQTQPTDMGDQGQKHPG